MPQRQSNTSKSRQPRVADDDTQNAQAHEEPEDLDREDAVAGDPDLDNDDFAPGRRDRSAVHQGQDQGFPQAEFDEAYEGEGWTPPQTLDAPPPRPGMVQRWIRAELNGSSDTKNLSQARREGWSPRDPKTVPEGWHPPTLAHGAMSGYIGVEGMVLMEMRAERNRQRQTYYRRRNAKQTEAIERDLFKQGGGQIRRSDKSRVTTGRRPQPAPAADDEA
jgi:hypothetical protein